MQNSHCQLCGSKHPGQTCATNPTTIQWKYGGTQVYVYGSWSQFQEKTKLEKAREHPYYHETTKVLTVGKHEYKFFVDGEWKIDVNERTVSCSFYGLNNQITVIPKRQIQTESDDQLIDLSPNLVSFKQQTSNTIRVKIKTTMDGSEIYVKGSWDMWQNAIKLQRRYLNYAEAFENYCYIQVQAGTYEYKFIIYNQWLHDPSQPSVENEHGSYNNIINIKRKQVIDCHRIVTNFSTVFWNQYKLSNLKFDRISGHSLNRIGNQFFVYGGCRTGTFSEKLLKLSGKSHQLDIVENTIGQTPEGRAYHNAIAYGSKIIFFGGLNSHEVFDEYFVLNTQTMEWNYSKLSGDIPQTRERASMTLLAKEDTLIYFGGYACTYDFEVEQVFNDVHCMNLKSMQWNKTVFQGQEPDPRYAHTSTQIQEKMYVFGGQNTSQNFSKNQNFNDVWILDFTQGTANWVALSGQIKGKPPLPRHGHSALAIQKHIVIIAGRGNTSKEVFNDIHILDVTKLEWTQPIVKGTQPSPRYYQAAEVFENDIWILGGNAGMKPNQHVYVMSFTENEDESGEQSSPVEITHKPQSNHHYLVHDDCDESSSDEEVSKQQRQGLRACNEESKN